MLKVVSHLLRITSQSLLILGLFVFSGYLATASSPATAQLMGVVTTQQGGTPLVGARITLGNQVVWSTSGGIYTLVIDPVGTYTVGCTKPGFDSYASAPITFQPGEIITHNIQLAVSAYPPGPVMATLDTLPSHTDLEWSPPSGSYELVYDDGIQDDFTVWATAGNMNAVRFTPVGFPAKVTGGLIHIGSASSYPAGSTPLVPFQVAVYDGSGSGGTPGVLIGGPFDVIPTGFGWVEFTFPSPVTLSGGSFFLAMIQGGNAPNAAGLAIDLTSPQLRSFSRFTAGGGPWFPASGNFLMRARMVGPGGPVTLSGDESSATQEYQVWRLRQGEEQNPTIWTLLGTTSATTYTDTEWPGLPCSPYRWGVKALYPVNRSSPATHSNVIGKCWDVPVTINVAYTCSATQPPGTTIRLCNLVYPDTLYTAQPQTGDPVVFPKVWKGTYELKITRFGYFTSTQTLVVTSPDTIDILLLQKKSPPTNLRVDSLSLIATWDIPRYDTTLFREEWSSGNFSTNGWTTEGGFNWIVSSVVGNPAPSAQFNWSPQARNYSQTLTSRIIPGQQSAAQDLRYDIYLDNFGTTTVNQMAVELWDGASWHALRSYSNAGGNIPWTSDRVDISVYSDNEFRVRFRAYGGDTFDIDGWNVDNIRVTASEAQSQQQACVLGYNFYLDNVISGFTPDNKYTIPGNQVQYGNSYLACVRAAYGSGLSEKICTPFTSGFLWPPKNLSGTMVEDVAYLTWLRPAVDTSSVTPPGLIGYKIYRNGVAIASLGSPDSLSYYDPGLDPGNYTYKVTAWYHLGPYGYPGQFAESVAAGPVDLVASFGRPLPFFEPWDGGSFGFNDWRFTSGQSNWEVNTTSGNPPPSANFRWDPPLTNYSFGLESTVFDASPVNCATIFLDFDLMLDNRLASGTERLVVEVFYNNTWHEKTSYINTEGFSWSQHHLDISQVKGKGFRIRFRAEGSSSADIFHWAIDNIHIYPVCLPAENLQGDILGSEAHLTWSPPDCTGGAIQLDEGFEGSAFPPNGWEVTQTNPVSTWSHTGITDPLGVHSGNFAASLQWDYSHQDEWLIVRNVLVGGDLHFWSYCYQGSSHGDHYYVAISTNQGGTWTNLLDLSALPYYPSANGYNEWQTPYTVDLSAYFGEQVDLAWHAVDAGGQGLWYPWAIDDCRIGGDKRSLDSSSFIELKSTSRQGVTGYDLYRRDPGSDDFLRVNQNPVADTAYVDPGLAEGEYAYFVRALFEECSSFTSSDTILLDVITTLQESTLQGVQVYPNPAREKITVRSDSPLQLVTLLDVAGSVVDQWHPLATKQLVIDLSPHPAGIYFLKTLVGNTYRVQKIALIH